MNFSRPDISRLDPDIRAYIEALEAEVERLQHSGSRGRSRAAIEPVEEEWDAAPEVSEPTEPPTTINILTAPGAGSAKRTPRHLYTRQRRGGMGVFDLETSEEEPPEILAVADESQHLLIITNKARAFRMPVSALPESSVRARGESIVAKMGLGSDERLAAILPDQAQGYIAMVSRRGNVRLLRHHVFGEHMKPGTVLYDVKAFGQMVGACWTPGDGDLFVATRQGRAIRFPEKLVPPAGGAGIRLPEGDEAVAIPAISPDSGVFMISADGKGTIRLMEGFSANKAPGASGKIAITTNQLISAAAAAAEDEIFIISHLGKIIRFQAGDVPAKDGIVQGVICMTLRGDEPRALAISQARRAL